MTDRYDVVDVSDLTDLLCERLKVDPRYVAEIRLRPREAKLTLTRFRDFDGSKLGPDGEPHFVETTVAIRT